MRMVLRCLPSVLLVCVTTLFASTLRAGNMPQRYSYTQVHMGMPVRLVVYANSEPQAQAACRKAFDRVAQLEALLSDYRPSSELRRLCERAGGPSVPVSNDLFRVVSFAQDIARLTEGAFDVTVGPVVRLWRDARRTGHLPADAERQAALRLVGFNKIILDRAQRSILLEKPGMQLDLGGIAKGYAGDCALEVLRRHGIMSALFEAGGDIVVGDPPPGTSGWKVAMLTRSRRRHIRTLANCAISTSGATEQFVEIGGKRYSHIVNPVSGLGLTHRTLVTVIAPYGLLSDPLSTALSVMGPDRGAQVLRQFPAVSASFVRDSYGTP